MTIAARLRKAGMIEMAEKVDAALSEYDAGRLTYGQFCIVFWQGVRCLKKGNAL